MATYLFPGFASRTQGFINDDTVPIQDYSIPERRPLPPAPNIYPNFDYDPTLLEPAPDTYPDSDYDPSLLDSYSEEKVDGRSFRQGHSQRSIIPDPVIIPTVTKGKFLVVGLFNPEM